MLIATTQYVLTLQVKRYCPFSFVQQNGALKVGDPVITRYIDDSIEGWIYNLMVI